MTTLLEPSNTILCSLFSLGKRLLFHYALLNSRDELTDNETIADVT